MKADDPVYPRKDTDERDGSSITYFGLSVRDHIAIEMMKSLVIKTPLIDQQGEHGIVVPDKVAHNLELADSAYWLADAMIEQSNK